MKEIHTVKLIGLGAMGCFFAPKLHKCLGDDFKVIASGERRKKLEEKGVTINGKQHFFPIVGTEDIENNAGNADKLNIMGTDLIIIAVKGYSLDQAISDIRPFVGEKTQIMCVMNGVNSEEQLIQCFGSEHVLYSYMRVSIVMKDGVTSFDPEVGKVHFGEKKNAPGHYTDRVQYIAALFDRAGIHYTIDEDMLRGLWFKFSCNVGENMTCAMLNIPFGAFKHSEYANYFRETGMREVIDIANKLDIDLNESDVVRQRKTLADLPYGNKPSTLQDLEAGKLTEVDMFAGEVIRLGKKLGVPTPMAEIYYKSIKAKEDVLESGGL
jgi:2-dehydropantoate 2-reductase